MITSLFTVVYGAYNKAKSFHPTWYAELSRNSFAVIKWNHATSLCQNIVLKALSSVKLKKMIMDIQKKIVDSMKSVRLSFTSCEAMYVFVDFMGNWNDAIKRKVERCHTATKIMMVPHCVCFWMPLIEVSELTRIVENVGRLQGRAVGVSSCSKTDNTTKESKRIFPICCMSKFNFVLSTFLPTLFADMVRVKYNKSKKRNRTARNLYSILFAIPLLSLIDKEWWGFRSKSSLCLYAMVK